MKKIILLVLIVALVAPPGADARLTHHQIRQAAAHWAEWMTGDKDSAGYTIGRCSRARCHVRLKETEFGDCTATVYIRPKHGRARETETIYRVRWVVGVTAAGLDCQ